MGFDNECVVNVQSLPFEYFCPVCWKLVYPNEALQTQCGHLFCEPCLAYVAATTAACPYDGFLATEASSKPMVVLNKSLAERIGEVAVYCLYSKSGCQWQGNLSECIIHGTSCAYGNSPVVCNNCATQILHCQVQEHAQLCPGVLSQRKQPSAAVPPGTAPAVPTTSAGSTWTSSFTGATAATNHGQTATQTEKAEEYQQRLLYEQYYKQQYPGYNPYIQQYQPQVAPGAVPPVAASQGQAVAPQTQTAEQFEQYYMQNYPGFNPCTQQYEPQFMHQYQNLSHHPQVQAPVVQLDHAHAQTQFMQPSNPPHIMPNQPQNQSRHPQVQLPIVHVQSQKNQMQCGPRQLAHVPPRQPHPQASQQLTHFPQLPAQPLNDPWSETGWKMKSLKIRVFDIQAIAWEKLQLNYLRKIFRNSGVLDVRLESGSDTVGTMVFSTQQDAAATLDRFGGGYLPGHSHRQMLELQWLDPPAGEGEKNPSCKGKSISRNMNSSKRKPKQRRDGMVPFEEFISERGREVVEKFCFKAICVVSSLKPTNRRSKRTVCTRLGTSIFHGIYKFATVKHAAGETWGGDFDLEDLLVSFWGCCIDKDADKVFSSSNVKLDEFRILDLLSPFYVLEDGKFPPYFDDLRSEIGRAPMDMDTDYEARLAHGMAVLSNAAIRTPDELAHLVEDFFIAWDGSDMRDRNIIESSADAKGKGDDWRPITNTDSLLQDIYMDARLDHPTGKLIYKHDPYDSRQLKPRYSGTIVSESLNHRHVLVHASQRSQIDRRSIFEDPRELVYFIFHYFPDFFPRFIAFLLKIMKMKRYPLIQRHCEGYFQK